MICGYPYLITYQKAIVLAERLESEDTSNSQFPVVGIGASAGGLDAVKEF